MSKPKDFRSWPTSCGFWLKFCGTLVFQTGAFWWESTALWCFIPSWDWSLISRHIQQVSDLCSDLWNEIIAIVFVFLSRIDGCIICLHMMPCDHVEKTVSCALCNACQHGSEFWLHSPWTLTIGKRGQLSSFGFSSENVPQRSDILAQLSVNKLWLFKGFSALTVSSTEQTDYNSRVITQEWWMPKQTRNCLGRSRLHDGWSGAIWFWRFLFVN